MQKIILLFVMALSACHLPSPVPQPGPDATDAAVLPVGDAAPLTCTIPGDPPACACEILASVLGCREGQPTKLGETCVDGSRHRLTVLYAADEETRSINCIVRGGTVERLRRECRVCN